MEVRSVFPGHRHTASAATRAVSDGSNLGGVDIDAETAERWGYLNRALLVKARSHVTELALYRLILPAAVALAKESVNNADTLPLLEGLLRRDTFPSSCAQTRRCPP